MEANHPTSGLRESSSYSPGRDIEQGPRGSASGESGPGRGAQGGGPGYGNEPAQAAKDALREGKQAAAKIGEEVRQQARSVLQELKGTAEDLISSNRDRARNQARSVSRALHRVAEDFERDSESKPLARITEAFAGSVDSAANWAENKEPRQIIRDVEDFARREPVLFLGGAMLIGVIGSRLLKASGQGAERGRIEDHQRARDSEGNLGSSAPIDDREPRGPLSNSGLGMPSASPVDVTRADDSRPDIRRDLTPDMGSDMRGGA